MCWSNYTIFVMFFSEVKFFKSFAFKVNNNRQHNIELVDIDLVNLFSTYDPAGRAHIAFSR